MSNPTNTYPALTEAEIRADVEKRLRSVCGDWADTEFQAIVNKVTGFRVKYGKHPESLALPMES